MRTSEQGTTEAFVLEYWPSIAGYFVPLALDTDSLSFSVSYLPAFRITTRIETIASLLLQGP